MEFAVEEIRQITESVWTSTLGMPIEPRADMKPSEMEHAIAACIQITGGWQAVIALYCPARLARSAAAAMFGVSDEAVTPDDLQDVMCELVNIIGGNVKGMLEGSCQISLPALVEGLNYSLIFPRHMLLSNATFQCQDQPLIVMFLGADKSRSRQ